MLDKLGPNRALIHFIDKEEAKTARFDHVLMRGTVDIWPSYAASPKFRLALPDVNILTSGQIRNVIKLQGREHVIYFFRAHVAEFYPDKKLIAYQKNN